MISLASSVGGLEGPLPLVSSATIAGEQAVSDERRYCLYMPIPDPDWKVVE